MPMTVQVVSQPPIKKVPMTARLEATPSPPPPVHVQRVQRSTIQTETEATPSTEYQPLK